MLNLDLENRFWNSGITLLAGIDEAGRGPLAGPVVAAAVVFPRGIEIDGINDSKVLTENARDRLFDLIMNKSLGVGIGMVDHSTIDRLNILNATFRAMHEAVAKLGLLPEHLLVDGPRFTGAGIPFTTIVDGDAKCFSIAAASIIAKVTRDEVMKKYDSLYPQYGFAKNKGYGTREHLEAIRRHGPCEIHRSSFRMPSGPQGGDPPQRRSP